MNQVIPAPRPDYRPEGYTERYVIAADPGRHGPLEITYRPPDAIGHARLCDAGRLTDEMFYSVAVSLLAGSLISWSLSGVDGKPIAINEANLKRVSNPLLQRMAGALLGNFPEPKTAEGENDGAASAAAA